MDAYKALQLLRVAFRTLLQQKLRSLLSVLGVVCGVTAVVAMIAIGEGAKRQTISQIEQLGTRNIYIRAVPLTQNQITQAKQRRSLGLTIDDVQRIMNGCAMTGDIAFLHEISTSILGLPREATPQVVACSANYAHLLGMHISTGRFIASLDEQRKNLVCVLGSEVARRIEGSGRPGNFLRIAGHIFKVVGILNRIEQPDGAAATVSTRNYNEMVFIPLQSAGAIADPLAGRRETTAASQLSEIVIQIGKAEDVASAARLVKRIMQVAHHGTHDYQFVLPLELLKQAERTQRTFNFVLGTIAGISLLVGGIGIMNIMIATVSERTREIGIRRAVGATRQHILTHFLLEAVILTISGGIIGLLGGIMAVGAISWFAGWRAAVSFWVMALPLIVSFLVGIFFGLYPARQAARVDPIVALRHE